MSAVPAVRATAAGLLLAVGLAGLGLAGAPGVAHAEGCVHREPGHVFRHGGQLVDDAYHRDRGEPLTCVWQPRESARSGDDGARSASGEQSRRKRDDDGWRDHDRKRRKKRHCGIVCRLF